MMGHRGRHGHGLHHHRPSFDNLPIDLDSALDGGSKPLLHYTFPADIDHFWLTQSSFAGPTRTQVVGKVIVYTCPKAENISAHFKIEASDDGILDKIEIEAKKTGLEFKLDPFSLVAQKVNATVYLVVPSKDEYKLNRLHIQTIQLNVWLSEGFTTPVNNTLINTVSGHVGSHGKDKSLDINNLKIKTVSGGIYGDYPLEHALALETASGDIKVHIATEERPEKKAWFKTETVSGSTHAVFVGNLTPRPVYSKHTSVSGDVSVFYPGDWLGSLKLETTSGSLDVIGDGTKIVKKEKSLTKKLWEVTKGEGESAKSRGYLGTVSGAIDVAFPEEDKE